MQYFHIVANSNVEQQVLGAVDDISASSPNHPVQVDAIAQATGLDARALQPALKALYEQGKFREIIGDEPITAVSPAQ